MQITMVSSKIDVKFFLIIEKTCILQLIKLHDVTGIFFFLKLFGISGGRSHRVN